VAFGVPPAVQLEHLRARGGGRKSTSEEQRLKCLINNNETRHKERERERERESLSAELIVSDCLFSMDCGAKCQPTTPHTFFAFRFLSQYLVFGPTEAPADQDGRVGVEGLEREHLGLRLMYIYRYSFSLSLSLVSSFRGAMESLERDYIGLIRYLMAEARD
jgi:hypothetical protein